MRLYKLIIIAMISFLLVGCYDINFRESKVMVSPRVTNLLIQGQWVIDGYEKNENGSLKKVDNFNGEIIQFSRELVTLIDNEFRYPQYKLKVVRNDYVISYENGINLSTYTESDEVKVFTIIQNNNSICEFYLLEKDKGIIFEDGDVILVKRISEEVDNRVVLADNENNNYNGYNLDETGVLLGIKGERVEEDGFKQESYRTLWISYNEGKLNPVMEQEGIIFPRVSGIWKIQPKNQIENGVYSEFFEVYPIDGQFEKSNKDIIKDNTYRSISFVGNNYISTQKYVGNDFQGMFNKYELNPIENINSSIGVSLLDIYPNESVEIYKREYTNALNTLTKEEESNYVSRPNSTNYKVTRNEGKWEIIGGIEPINNDNNSIDFKSSIKISNKIVNYDILSIPWRGLKSDILYLRDAYTSPNEKLAIVVSSDQLLIYRIEDDKLEKTPLKMIEIGENDEIIMAEWCTEGYVDRWGKYFDSGKVLD